MDPDRRTVVSTLVTLYRVLVLLVNGNILCYYEQ
jgi:hypothetical protein